MRSRLFLLSALLLGSLRADILYSVTDLGTPGGASTMGYGINNLGQVVGSSSTSSGSLHPFLYSNGQMIDLNIGGNAYAINDNGQITGSLGAHAFLYSNGQFKDLGALPGDSALSVTPSMILGK